MSAPSASSARHVTVSFFIQILKHSESRLILKLTIKLLKKIRNYTKEKLMKVRKKLTIKLLKKIRGYTKEKLIKIRKELV